MSNGDRDILSRSQSETKISVIDRRTLGGEEEVQELNKRLTTIDCQLRKSELSRKHLEISNKRLLGFAQVPLSYLSTSEAFCVEHREADPEFLCGN